MYSIPSKISVSPMRAVFSRNTTDALFVGSSLKYDNFRQGVYSVGKENPFGCFEDWQKWLLTDEYKSSVKKYLKTVRAEVISHVLPTPTITEKRFKRSGEGYKLNKTKLREKCVAYAELERSRKFSAFYSISFPLGISEHDAVKAFNTWRTRCARDFGLISYIRVCEHQKNGTIHFHMLTNCYLPIKKVNRALAVTLDNLQLLKDQFGHRLTVDKYNGVDVQRVKDVHGVLKYLSKYISKGLDTFTVLPCHWSRDVSALFTRCNVDYDARLDTRGESDTFTITNEWCDVVYHHGKLPIGFALYNLRRLNSIIFDKYIESCRKKNYYGDNCYVRNNLGYNRKMLTFDKAIQATAKVMRLPESVIENTLGILTGNNENCPF